MQQNAILNCLYSKVQKKEEKKMKKRTCIIGGIVILSVILAIILVNNIQKTTPASSGQTQIANPFVECASIEKGMELSGVTIKKLPTLLEHYSLSSVYAMQNKLIELRFTNENSKITIRKSKGIEDNSGDYSIYPQKNAIVLQDLQITTKGNKDLIHTAIWHQGNYSFSITTTLTALTQDELIQIINTL